MKVKCSSASHEGALGIGGIASLILNLGTIRKLVVRHYPCVFTEVPVSESWIVQALCMDFFSVGEWWCRLSPNVRRSTPFDRAVLEKRLRKFRKYRVIQNYCRGFNNLSYTVHLK